jgi:hypothetical protein
MMPLPVGPVRPRHTEPRHAEKHPEERQAAAAEDGREGEAVSLRHLPLPQPAAGEDAGAVVLPEMSRCGRRAGGPPMTIEPGRYRHYKGREYTVLGLARHSETLEELVVYRQEYGDRGLWVRPAAMFAETVVVDGRATPRFARVPDGG